MELNEKIEDELDKQFPKGDQARGRALVLHAIAQIEIKEINTRVLKWANKWGYKGISKECEDELNTILTGGKE